MAGKDKFSLRFSGFERSVKTSWQNFQIEEHLYDMTLACEDKQIKAHRLIVSSFSPVLRNILMLNQSPNQVIYLRRVKYKDLQNLISYMYQGEVNVAEEDVSGFLEVAEDLNIKGLSEGNVGGYDSNEENPSISVPSNIDPSPKINRRLVENEMQPNINRSRPSDFSTNFVEENDSDNMFSPGNTKKLSIKKFEEDSKQNIVSTVATLTGKQSSCENCNKIFSNRQGLYVHNKSVHERRRYSCEHCEYEAGHRSNLSKHKKSAHEGVRHSCIQCDYKTADRSNLAKHIKSNH